MTVQFNEERYQSDRLTFEHQQFEETIKQKLYDGEVDEMTFAKHADGTYQVLWLDNYWDGWKLSRGLI